MPQATREKFGEPAHDLLALCLKLHTAKTGSYQPCDDEISLALEILNHAVVNWDETTISPRWDEALFTLIMETLAEYRPC